MLADVTSKKLIRKNLRYAAYSGTYNGQKVFIKTAVDPKLHAGIQSEAIGLERMASLDPDQRHYSVPAVLDVSEGGIVTSWADGPLMQDVYKRHHAQHSATLIDLYSYLDSKSVSQIGTTRFNRPDQENRITKTMKRLEALEYGKHIDRGLVEATAKFAMNAASTIETRFTHGDLHPGNIIVTSNRPWIIDCESCDDLWPRHYNIVNFVFNYGMPPSSWMREHLADCFKGYFFKIQIDPAEHMTQINFSAAVRCLQSLVEILGGNTEAGKECLEDFQHYYLTNTMQRIVDGELFVELRRSNHVA